MNKRLVIQQFTSTQNASGELVESWTTYGTFWGSLAQLSGREMFLAQQVKAVNQYKAQIRHCTGSKAITEKMRLVYDFKTYDINAVIDVGGKGRIIEIMLTEVV